MTDWMKKLTKDFGTIGAELPSPKDSVITMPSPSLNWAVGNNGIAEGKAVCFYGPESSGKSLLAQLTFIEIQKKDPEAIVIWFDAEFSFNKDWFQKLGGDLDRIIVRSSNDPVQIFDFIYGDMYQMMQDGAPIRAIALDSVKSVAYPKDIKDVSTKLTMGGGGASYLGPALKRVLPVIREFNITTLFVQQVYEELDPMKAMRNPYKIPDGRALKHFCDYMLEVTKIENKKSIVERGSNIYGTGAQMGHTVRVKCKKNRVGAPARVAEFTLDYEQGIVDTEREIVKLAKSLNIVYHPLSATTGKPSNMMWQFATYQPVRGEANFDIWVAENPEIQAEIIDACNGVAEDIDQVLDSDILDISIDIENV